MQPSATHPSHAAATCEPHRKSLAQVAAATDHHSPNRDVRNRTNSAAVWTGPRSIEFRELDEPLEPAAGQIRVRLEGCGVCGSNVPVSQGRPWFQYPLAPGAPGHEGWGRIDAIGNGVKEFLVGDRVAMLSYRAFASFDLAEASAAIRLPDALQGMPFPAEPLACALNVFRRCDIQAGQNVAIVGIGFLGALLTQLAVNAGARVLAISRRAWALELAEQAGASGSVEFQEIDTTCSSALKWNHGAEFDRVIEATGLAEPLDLAARLTRVRGRLIIAGYHQDGPRQVDMQLWNWRGIDVINAHERDPAEYVTGMRAALTEVLEGRLALQPLLTHRFAFHELPQALEATCDRPRGFLKALVMLDT